MSTWNNNIPFWQQHQFGVGPGQPTFTNGHVYTQPPPPPTVYSVGVYYPVPTPGQAQPSHVLIVLTGHPYPPDNPQGIWIPYGMPMNPFPGCYPRSEMDSGDDDSTGTPPQLMLQQPPPPGSQQPMPLMALNVPAPTYGSGSTFVDGNELMMAGAGVELRDLDLQPQEERYVEAQLEMPYPRPLSAGQEQADEMGVPPMSDVTIVPVNTNGPSSSNGGHHRGNAFQRSCAFCKSNGEAKEVWSSHSIRDENGKTTCPILCKYVCELCQQTGENAHTKGYCPLNKGQVPKHIHIRTGRNAAGKFGRYKHYYNNN